MYKLEKLLAELCPNGVEKHRLEDCCIIHDNKRKPITKGQRISGNYPYYGANGIQDYVEDFIFDGTFVLVGEDGSVITDRGTPVVTWATGKIWVNNHAHIISEKQGVILRYLYHYLQIVDVTALIHGNIPKLTGSDFRNLKTPVPPLEVQAEIVRILDEYSESVTALQQELEKELTARKKQYEYYRDELLSFGSDCEWRTLRELAEIGTGSSNTNEAVEDGEYPFFVRSQEALRKDSYEYDETAIITAGDGVGVGKVFHYVEGKYALHQRAYRIHITSNDVIPKFFFQYMKATFYDYISKAGFHSSVSSIRRPMLNEYPIPVPSLEEQERIVSILDRFDKLCNDISEGLPAEIEARRKQYEYYRDKLLSFKEVRV